MIVSITSLKGGTGKSTLSQNLSVCFAHMGYKTVLIDTDTNNSSVMWSGLRSEVLPEITVIGLQDERALQKNIRQLEKDYEIIVIDGTPAISRLVSTIILLGDIVLVPSRPSGLDLWATQKFLEHYEQARLIKPEIRAYLILNQYDKHMVFNRESMRAVEQVGIQLMETTIKTRISYAEVVVQGMGVIEYSDRKAKREMIQLTKEILAKYKLEEDEA